MKTHEVIIINECHPPRGGTRFTYSVLQTFLRISFVSKVFRTFAAYMRRLPHILLCLWALCMLIGCAGDGYTPALRTADSLMNDSPSVALAMLDSLKGEAQGWSKAQRMRYHLLTMKARNKAYVDFTSDSLAKEVVEYYDNHGTANDRLLAHYLLGCVYRDLGEAPRALESYHNASDCADTTSADCDYRQLMVLHSQMASLFYEQLLPYEYMEELKEQYKYALLAKDTLSAINAIENKAGYYTLIDMPDSIIQIREMANKLYNKHQFKKEAALSVGPIINILIDKGDFEKAKLYLGIYESEALNNGKVEDNKAVYYYFKGKYYLSINKTDSAQIMFRRLFQSRMSPNQIEAGYLGLFMLYEQSNQKDSLVKYARLSYEMNKKIYLKASSSNLQKMQSLYNYTRSQQLAQQMSDKAHRHQLMLYIVVFSTILILFLIGAAWWKKQENHNQLKRLYEDGKEKLRKAKEDLEIMESSLNENNAEHVLLLEKKNLEILSYQEQINTLEARLNVNSVSVTKKELMDTPIYQRVQAILTQPKQQMTKRDWAQLRRMIDQKIPSFYSEMNSHKGKLPQQDYDICILVRLYLTPKDIVILTGYSYSVVSMKRTRLLKKIFGIEGSPEKFDELVQKII